MYIYLPVTDAYIKCRYSSRMLSQYLSDAMKQLFLWLFLGKSNTMLCLFSASWICAHAGLIYITAHYILATVRKKTQKSGHLILRFLHDTCSSTLSAATMHGTRPSCHYTPPPVINELRVSGRRGADGHIWCLILREMPVNPTSCCWMFASDTALATVESLIV